jgi:hypothetical protein
MTTAITANSSSSNEVVCSNTALLHISDGFQTCAHHQAGVRIVLEQLYTRHQAQQCDRCWFMTGARGIYTVLVNAQQACVTTNSVTHFKWRISAWQGCTLSEHPLPG